MRYILLILLLIPLVYAQDQIILSKDVYQQKEMFQAEVLMNDIKPYDISILNSLGYKSNVGVSLLKLTKNHHFIFFEVPQLDQGNYTLKIKEELKQFQVNEERTKLSISTGAVKYTPEDSLFFKITLTNNDIKSQTIDITSSSLSLIPSLNSVILPGKSSKSFNIKLEKQSFNFLTVLSIDNFNLPVWYIVGAETIPFFEIDVEPKEQKEERGLEFYTKSGTKLNYITKEIQESIPIIDSIIFKNALNITLNNLKISLTGNLEDIINLGSTEVEVLVPNEEKKLDITVNENRILLEEFYSGDLLISSENYTFKLPIDFKVVEKAEEPEVLTVEETTEELPEEPEVNKTITPEVVEEKLAGKWIYLIVLITILIIFAYISLRKPKAKKTSFKDFIKKAGY
jgi:hypothetical protein